MSNREKVIGTLEEIKTQTAEIGLDSAVIAHKFIDKILALLNEQNQKIDELEQEKCRITHIGAMLAKELQAVNGDGWIMKDTKSIVETMKEMGYVMVVRCKDCKHGVKSATFRYYPNLTWCNQHSTSHNDDWFCADGIAKGYRCP